MRAISIVLLLLATSILAFSCVISRGTPADTIPSGPEATRHYLHRVEPGDIIVVSIWEAEGPKEYEVQVNREGNIDLMFLEDLKVMGLTEPELDDFLTMELKNYYVDPRVHVSIKEMVYVFGEAKAPGSYDFERGLTLAAILASAGGPTDDAKLKNVLVIRGYYTNPHVIVSDISKMLKKGDISQNIVMEGGDIVYLPSRVITNVNYFLEQIKPILDTLMLPIRFIP